MEMKRVLLLSIRKSCRAAHSDGQFIRSINQLLRVIARGRICVAEMRNHMLKMLKVTVESVLY
jgi:hypothetical protein